MASLTNVIELNDFSGGLNVSDPEYLLPLNSSPDCQNITLLPKGWRKRYGDSAFNSSAMVSGSTAITGLGYFKLNGSNDYLNAVAGTKFFTSVSLSGTMADATGAVSITSGTTNIWTPVNFGALQVWFGGAPDAPFKYSGTGNAAALGGSPPSAATGFQANNRLFGISTSANPSRIYWSVLGNAEDWTGTGSGNADVSTNDGESLQLGIPVNTDTAILFKNSSTHVMNLTRSPFPVYQLQKGTGVCGRYGAVNVDGTIYFVTPSRRMKATSNGVTFQDFPDSIDPIWDRINTTRISYIYGIYHQREDQIHWYVSLDSAQTNNYCIIWDLKRKCWLVNSTGYKCNVACLAENRRLFAGHYDGKVYEKDLSTTYNDASESGAAISAYWRTPYQGLEGLDSTIHPLYVNFSAAAVNNSTLTISYGFDYQSTSNSETFDLQTTSSLWDQDTWDGTLIWAFATGSILIDRKNVTGRGNLFSVKFENSTTSQDLTFQGASVRLRPTKARKQMVVG
jgi:hypothetical protein